MVDNLDNIYGLIRYSETENNYIPMYRSNKRKVYSSDFYLSRYKRMKKEKDIDVAKFVVELKIADLNVYTPKK